MRTWYLCFKFSFTGTCKLNIFIIEICVMKKRVIFIMELDNVDYYWIFSLDL
jgi:hypothetical protein